MRYEYTYDTTLKDITLENLIAFSDNFKIGSLMISSNSEDTYAEYDCVFAFQSLDTLISKKDSFNRLRQFQSLHKDWMFGFLSYDLKNELESLTSSNLDCFDFPNMLFYVPETIFLFKNNKLYVKSVLNKSKIDSYINDIKNCKVLKKKKDHVKLTFRESKIEYLDKIRHIKSHIQTGDIYEMNYCQELYANTDLYNIQNVFLSAHEKSNAPFSVFFWFEDKYLLCTSPEIYLKKAGNKIIAQPIKGTRRRGLNKQEDIKLRKDLLDSEKDRSENIMIADLVRNDLSITASINSVCVQELCKVYTFDRVHQMISTITSDLDSNYDFVDVLSSTFPMASMTGVPKIKAMDLIEKYETTKRSLFSGSFGYITPDLDFDFNVVIRSIIYNDISKYLSVMVGGAITIASNADDEYNECLVKAQALIDVLNDER